MVKQQGRDAVCLRHGNAVSVRGDDKGIPVNVGLCMANTFMINRSTCTAVSTSSPSRKESSGECVGGAATYVRYIYYIHMSATLIATVTIIHVNPMIEGLSCSYRHDRSLEKYIIITIMTMFDMLTAIFAVVNDTSMAVCSGAVVSNAFILITCSDAFLYFGRKNRYANLNCPSKS